MHPEMQTQAQIKRNLKLHAITSMQTKKKGKYEITLPPCLDKALFKRNKATEGKGKTK